MKTVIINHKKYTVEYVFNMVGNYYFTDKNGLAHLVDAEDIIEWTGDTCNLNDAIAYAKYYAKEAWDGAFWWKVKEV